MEDSPDQLKSNDTSDERDGTTKAQNLNVQSDEKTNFLNNNMPHNAPHNLVKSSNRLANQVSTSGNQPQTNFDSNDKSPPSSPITNQAKKNYSSDSTKTLMHNWQATKTTVRERLAFMFHNEILCDIHFVVGKNHSKQRIPAHKFVLSCGSAVFDAMFNGPLSTEADEIELPDVEPSAFLSLLRCMYSDEVQIGPETVMATLYVAKKYGVPALEKACVEFLEKNLGSENAFTLLTQARLFDESKLAALCLETIDKNSSKAFAADGFFDIDIDTLCDVIKRDSLRISEAKLFEAVVKWAEAKCSRQNRSPTSENLRAVIGKALKLIRFPLMSIEEFASFAAQSGILTDREALQLFLYFTVNPKPNLGFLDMPRCCMTDNEITVSRFRCIDSRWGYSGTSDRVRLVVDRRIFVVGFGLYGATHGPAEYDVLMQLINLSTGKVCGSNKTSFSCDGSNFTFRVMFKEPVEVQPHTSYIAAVTLKGPDSHYGTKGLQKVALDIPGKGNGKVTFEFYVAGINNGTSVEDGQIPEIIFFV